jgi:hypothetical protein
MGEEGWLRISDAHCVVIRLCFFIVSGTNHSNIYACIYSLLKPEMSDLLRPEQVD